LFFFSSVDRSRSIILFRSLCIALFFILPLVKLFSLPLAVLPLLAQTGKKRERGKERKKIYYYFFFFFFSLARVRVYYLSRAREAVVVACEALECDADVAFFLSGSRNLRLPRV